MNDILTVSEVNARLKKMIDNDVNLTSVFIQGEISNFTNHMKSGHFYFTLKDKNAAIRAVMFRGNNIRLPFLPENGMKVIAFGSVQLYEKTGECQLICADMQPDGVGALYMALEQIKAKLEREGLFDPALKKPLPPLPRRIGVITAKTGAALQDIIRILSERYPIGELVLIPSLVQGVMAPASIIKALEKAEKADLDVLILARGGGSIEDLWAFNDEEVARAVSRCSIPVITGVGHETDFTVVDFVSDFRAPTPSGAAMAAAPDTHELYFYILDAKEQLFDRFCIQLERSEYALSSLKTRLLGHSPEKSLREKEEKLLELTRRLSRGEAELYQKNEQRFLRSTASLEALSPLKVLTRGYSITYRGKNILTDSHMLSAGDTLTTRLSDGQVTSVVTDIENEES